MAERRGEGPYIWITWLTRLLAGESICEWASWFKAQHEGDSWAREPSSFNMARWQVGHTDMLRWCAREYRLAGYTVNLEGQNSITLRGKAATVAGKPDLVVQREQEVKVIDIKTGRPKASDEIQVMLYMYLLPLARSEYRDCTITGLVVYGDHEVEIPAEAVDEGFLASVREVVARLAFRDPAVRVPSWGECRFCEITSADCPERVEGPAPGVATTEAF